MNHPKLHDFLRMIARERKWANEGSLYAVSDALKVIIVVIAVNPNTHEKDFINKYVPNTVHSFVPFTIVNETQRHFIAAHRKINSTTFSKKTWQDINLITIKVDANIKDNDYHDNILEKRQNRTIIQEIIDNTNKSIKPNAILNQIHHSDTFYKISNVFKNHQTTFLEIHNIKEMVKTEYKDFLNENYSPKKSVNLRRFPKILHNNFIIDNVEPDGNCYFRSIAEILLNNEERFHEIKIFILYHIMMNLNFYEKLCITKVIEVCKGNNDNDIIENPKIDDFLRMIAADGIWGNEGSIIALSHALETSLLIFVVNGITETLQLVIETKPITMKYLKVLTMINMDNIHFYVCRLKNDIKNINEFLKINEKELNKFAHIEYDIHQLHKEN